MSSVFFEFIGGLNFEISNSYRVKISSRQKACSREILVPDFCFCSFSDNVIGTSSKPPRLVSENEFSDGKYRYKNCVKFIDSKMWNSIEKGSFIPTYQKDDEARTIAPKVPDLYRIWDALIQMYEGIEYMNESRKDMLRQRFNMFNNILGESLETQINRFVHLIIEMRSDEIEMTNGEVNKKLLNSLPYSWNMNATSVKRSNDMYKTSLADFISIIKSYEMDDKQRALNQANSTGNAAA
ncbi:hypothetical protein L1987_42427 [Smallanthus sonchifolius]|uniref:Uncharacterized protein n=1 Tax=Smallanthus sonchifolius TaxID=185202 RepID=A0ACB9GJX6_9ASTR|nr:hypothetical protein L1987_42427 [Smallanthus sonchifolius]